MGDKFCRNSNCEPRSKPNILPDGLAQFFPVQPLLQLHMYDPHPLEHSPSFLHGLEAQKSRFSGHPAIEPLLCTRLFILITSLSIWRSLIHPTKESVENLERMVLLRILDDKWKDHINNLEQLRQTIGLRGYGQRDPLNEYKNESFNLFVDTTREIKYNSVYNILNSRFL